MASAMPQTRSTPEASANGIDPVKAATIFAVDNFDPAPSEELVCTICFCVFNDPVESPCRHVFCRSCITKWLSEKASCPICRKYMNTLRITECLPIVKSIINRLTLHCENKSMGCTEKVTVEGYNKHMGECLYQDIRCPNPTCKHKCLRKDMKRHESSCKKRLTMCSRLCKRPIRLDRMEKHDCAKELKKFNTELLEKVTKLEEKVEALEKELREHRSAANSRQQSASGGGSGNGLNVLFGMMNNALRGDHDMDDFSTDSDSYHPIEDDHDDDFSYSDDDDDLSLDSHRWDNGDF